MSISKNKMQGIMRYLAMTFPATDFVLLAHTQKTGEEALRQVATTTEDEELIRDMCQNHLDHMKESKGERFAT